MAEHDHRLRRNRNDPQGPSAAAGRGAIAACPNKRCVTIGAAAGAFGPGEAQLD
jgi:hypothetical protein